MASQSRQERVAEAIQHEVGQMLIRGLKDPRIGLVTVTGAKVSPDLREAWVYYAVHGDARVRQDTAVGLEAAKGFVRREIGKAIRLRNTPELHFVVDESIDRGERIDQLLRQVHAEDVERSKPEDAGEGADAPAAGDADGPGKKQV